MFLISRVGLEDTSGLNRETEPPPPPPPHRYAPLLFLRAEASSLCDADDEPITAELREKQKKKKTQKANKPRLNAARFIKIE